VISCFELFTDSEFRIIGFSVAYAQMTITNAAVSV